MKRKVFCFPAVLLFLILNLPISYAGDSGRNGDPTKQVMEQSAEGAHKKKWKKTNETLKTAVSADREAPQTVTENVSSKEEKKDKGISAAQNNRNTSARDNGMAATGGRGMGMGGGMGIGGIGGRGRPGGRFFPGGGFGGGQIQQPGGTSGGRGIEEPVTGGGSTQDPTGGDATTTAEPTESSDLNEFINEYSDAADQETARAALSDIVDLVKSDSSLEEVFIDYFNLSGEALEIWETYGVLVVDSSSGNDFTDAQLSEISEVLSSLPADDVAQINVITTTTASEGSNDSLLGFTYSDTDNGTVVINTSSSYISGSSDAMQTFASTLSHEIGHRVQYALSSEDSAEFTALHEASGNDVQNYASAYGMTEYSLEDPGYEDFATMYETWCTDSEMLISRAESQAESGSSVLLEKVKFMAKLFAHTGSDGSTYTYVYATDSGGNVTRAEVLLGNDGLPVMG